MVDQGNYRGWAGGGAIALAMGLSATAAWGSAPSSASSVERSPLSGITVPGGSGAINVTGHLINSSCAVSVDKNSAEFTLSQSQVQTAVLNDVLATIPFTFTLTQCANMPVVFMLTMSNSQDYSYSFDKIGSLIYRLFLFANNINQEQWQGIERSQTKSLVINENGGIPLRNYNTAQRAALLFSPRAESEQFTINMVVIKSSMNYSPPSIAAEEITTSFTYEFTYL
ncbi:type-1 fimbrial protein, a chain [Edwardsiella tarda]|uniref:type-1 fimbrial protein, a chain n=1 Tax=Edwardsiella tarda TaxID=636 RepID=UPI00266EC993|nr:type-1 fimbrial protein, a chain [Edwardsiella tarda]WKS82286.1 type-1 fimbrial protein, a chain [Edwardsiella tarda]